MDPEHPEAVMPTAHWVATTTILNAVELPTEEGATYATARRAIRQGEIFFDPTCTFVATEDGKDQPLPSPPSSSASLTVVELPRQSHGFMSYSYSSLSGKLQHLLATSATTPNVIFFHDATRPHFLGWRVDKSIEQGETLMVHTGRLVSSFHTNFNNNYNDLDKATLCFRERRKSYRHTRTTFMSRWELLSLGLADLDKDFATSVPFVFTAQISEDYSQELRVGPRQFISDTIVPFGKASDDNKPTETWIISQCQSNEDDSDETGAPWTSVSFSGLLSLYKNAKYATAYFTHRAGTGLLKHFEELGLRFLPLTLKLCNFNDTSFQCFFTFDATTTDSAGQKAKKRKRSDMQRDEHHLCNLLVKSFDEPTSDETDLSVLEPGKKLRLFRCSSLGEYSVYRPRARSGEGTGDGSLPRTLSNATDPFSLPVSSESDDRSSSEDEDANSLSGGLAQTLSSGVIFTRATSNANREGATTLRKSKAGEIRTRSFRDFAPASLPLASSPPSRGAAASAGGSRIASRLQENASNSAFFELFGDSEGCTQIPTNVRDHLRFCCSELVATLAKPVGYYDSGFEEDFARITSASSAIAPVFANQSLETRRRNRYANVLPLASTNVTLHPVDKVAWGGNAGDSTASEDIIEGSRPRGATVEQTSAYINANFVARDVDFSHEVSVDPSRQVGDMSSALYIAAQAPKSAYLDEWWIMIWDYNVPVIVMVTNCTEGKKRKADPYWPVSTLGKAQTADIDSNIENPEVHNGDGSHSTPRIVTQLHFLGWPDFDVPAEVAMLDPLLEAMASVRRDTEVSSTM
eukprot:g4960.t1